jgi:unsaturated rhamnogalacturonyl hydrolase
MNKRLLILLGFFAIIIGKSFCQQADALSTVKKIADKIIADTRFEFKLVPQQEVLGIQVVDAKFLSPSVSEYVYATRTATAAKDATVRFGINTGVSVRIWVNYKLIFQQTAQQSINPVEIAYDKFRFQQSFSTVIKKGENRFLIEMAGGQSVPVVLFRPVNENNYLDSSINFSNAQSWLFTGPFPSAMGMQPNQLFSAYGKNYVWQTAPQHFIPELIVDKNAAYQRDPYSDWQYSHGIMMWTILQLGLTSTDQRYHDFVKKYTDFPLSQLDYFRWQYDSLYAFRGSYHRIFRRTMLDDAGAPVLPFMAIYLEKKDTAMRRIIDPIMHYVSEGQTRLPDGTFCRPEPTEFTVWCDDLFMSVPLLLQMAALTGDQKYYDDAARQAINFQKYLLDPQTGLYAHGWFSTTQSRSPVFWGRANGWIAWATAELLDKLPVKHPLYKTILKKFQKYMGTLANYQSTDGMWHQVLNNDKSYEETSCTAMFSFAMARGVRRGWLSAKYKSNAIKGWNAVASHVSSDGVVHGICRGTDIGYDQQFYMDRKTIDNDPRGLGAVIAAGIEISKL